VTSPNHPPLISRRLIDGHWSVVVAAVWKVHGEDFTLTIPPGFKTDLASVPRILWVLVARDELSFGGPIAHDFLYQCGGVPPAGTCYPSTKTFTRREVDALFSSLMREFGVVPWRRRAAWLAVRLFGWIPWKPNKRA
jgi:hypothetical protein